MDLYTRTQLPIFLPKYLCVKHRSCTRQKSQALGRVQYSTHGVIGYQRVAHKWPQTLGEVAQGSSVGWVLVDVEVVVGGMMFRFVAMWWGWQSGWQSGWVGWVGVELGWLWQ